MTGPIKEAFIKPIHKMNKITDPTSYRPLAICDRVYKFCEKLKVFDDCQMTFAIIDPRLWQYIYIHKIFLI